MRKYFCVIFTVLLSSCGGGSTTSPTSSLPDLEFEEYIMRGVADDIDYVGNLQPMFDLDTVAASFNFFTATERNEIPLDARCRFRLFTSQGAIIEWFPSTDRDIYFTDGGRLSGGFALAGLPETRPEGFYIESKIVLLDQDAFPVEVVFFTPLTYGENIVINVTTVGRSETITRILQLSACDV